MATKRCIIYIFTFPDPNDPGTGPDLSQPAPQHHGPQTTDGEECHLPYNYKGKAYTTCISADHGQPW